MDFGATEIGKIHIYKNPLWVKFAITCLKRIKPFYSAEICLYYPSSSIVSTFISKHIEQSYQFVSFNLHSSHLDKRQLQESVTGPPCTLYTPIVARSIAVKVL